MLRKALCYIRIVSKLLTTGEFSTKEVEVQNKDGLHARPAARFVKTAIQFQSHLYVQTKDSLVDGKSVFGILSLAAGVGTKLVIHTQGPDADQALNALAALFHPENSQAL